MTWERFEDQFGFINFRNVTQNPVVSNISIRDFGHVFFVAIDSTLGNRLGACKLLEEIQTRNIPGQELHCAAIAPSFTYASIDRPNALLLFQAVQAAEPSFEEIREQINDLLKISLPLLAPSALASQHVQTSQSSRPRADANASVIRPPVQMPIATTRDATALSRINELSSAAYFPSPSRSQQQVAQQLPLHDPKGFTMGQLSRDIYDGANSGLLCRSCLLDQKRIPLDMCREINHPRW